MFRVDREIDSYNYGPFCSPLTRYCRQIIDLLSSENTSNSLAELNGDRLSVHNLSPICI